jgi:hypothetical protein
MQICAEPTLALGSEPRLPLADGNVQESTTALVPVAAAAVPGNSKLLFHKLAKLGAFVHGRGNAEVSFDRPEFSGVQETSIAPLVEAGVVRARRDEADGKFRLAICSQSCAWNMSYGLRYPVPLARGTSYKEPLHKSKVELIVLLRRDGWVPDRSPSPATLTSRFLFRVSRRALPTSQLCMTWN